MTIGPKVRPAHGVKLSTGTATDVRGGNVQSCWAAPEIDKMLQSAAAMPAETTFRWIHGDLSTARIRATLLKTKKTLTVLWVRHHWILAHFPRGIEESVDIYDSARSAPVARDITRLFQQLCLRTPNFKSCPQQERGTDECGVFVVLNALLLNNGQRIPATTAKISLASLRALYPDASKFAAEGRRCYDRTLAGRQDARTTTADETHAKGGVHHQMDTLAGGGRQPTTQETVRQHIIAHDQGAQAAAQWNLCYVWASMALVNIARTLMDMPQLKTTLADTAELARTLAIAPDGEEGDSLEVLDALYMRSMSPLRTSFCLVDAKTGEMRLENNTTPQRLHLVYCAPATTLPPQSMQDGTRYTAVAGVKFEGKLEFHGEHASARHGHYRLVAGTSNANVKLYLREDAKILRTPATTTKKQPTAVLTPTPKPGRPAVENAFLTGWKEGTTSKSSETRVDPFLKPGTTGTTCIGIPQRAMGERITIGKTTREWTAGGWRTVSEVVELPRKKPAQTNNRTPAIDPQREAAATVMPATSKTTSENQMVLSNRDARNIARALRVGDAIRVRWGFGEQTGTWFGSVKTARTVGAAGTLAVVDYNAQVCETCGGTRELKGFLDTDLPFEGVEYIEIGVAKPPPACGCAQYRPAVKRNMAKTALAPLSSTPAVTSAPARKHAHPQDETDESTTMKMNNGRTTKATGRTIGKTPTHPQLDEMCGAEALRQPESRMHSTLAPKNESVDKPRVEICPRTWYVYPQKPPHVTQMAWLALTPEVRGQQRRWLIELRAMPADLLEIPLASAALELIRRHAVARRWKWSTTSKALTSLRGAVLNLPMYTNHHTGIDLGIHPEWRAACTTARRYQREVPAQPPTPVTLSEVLEARRVLKQAPSAQLLLGMMWAFAARCGCVTQLNKEDIQLEEMTTTTTSLRLVGVNITFRRGKGARFRGPYCSVGTLTPEDAELLRRRLQELRPPQRIFEKNGARERNLVRSALREETPQAALPSLRKGAGQHMATIGVPLAHIQLLLGHSRLDTTRRYLGYGLRTTTDDEKTRKSAALLHKALKE